MRLPVPVTLGSRDAETFDTADFHLVHASFPAGTFLAPHVHERATFAVMLDGAFDLRFPGRCFTCIPSSVFVEPAGERHSNQVTSRGAEVLVVQPAPEVVADDGAWRALFTAVSFRRHPQIGTLARRLVPEIRRPDPFSELAAHGVILDMLVAAIRSESQRRRVLGGVRPSPEVLRAREMLQEGSLAQMRLPAIAASLQMPVTRLYHEFKAHFNDTPAAYARRARLERAASLLTSTDDAIARIAAATDFADQSHLTRAFRRYFGVTPGAYRRRLGRSATPPSGHP
jgi:AraC family transcriptional regulator